MKSTLDVGDRDELGSAHSIEMNFDVRHVPVFTDQMTVRSVRVVNIEPW